MQQRRDTPALSLTILGTCTPYPKPDQPCSGYLVRSSDVRIWLEVGSGTLAALQSHMDPDEIDAIWFSHMHPDHAGDLPAVANWLLNRSGQREPLMVLGPSGWDERLAAFLPTSPQLLRSCLDARWISDGHSVTIGDLRLTSRAVRHSVDAYGVRVELGAHALAFSGDTGPCAALDDLANQADLFLCEAGASVREVNDAAAHCTPEEAADTARRAKAKQLLLTHISPATTPVVAQARAASVYARTSIAERGATYEF